MTPHALISSPIHIAIAATVVMSMGWLVTAQQAPAIPATYRATCEFSPQGEWFNTTCTTLSDHPPGGRRPTPTMQEVGQYGRTLILSRPRRTPRRNLNLTSRTHRALLNRPTKHMPTKHIPLILDSGCTMSCHPVESDLINTRTCQDISPSGRSDPTRRLK